MGYETKAFIVQRYSFETGRDTESLNILAMVNLCKCGNVPFEQLRQKYKANPISEKTFSLYKFGHFNFNEEFQESLKEEQVDDQERDQGLQYQ